MIDRIRGKVVAMEPTRLVLMTGGLGLTVSISLNTYERLSPTTGSELELATYLHVREEVLALYGFAEVEERETFLALLGISGVGPRVAMALLSALEVHALRDAVAAGDWKRLTAAPGVGKKLAERLVVELRDKFSAGLASGESAAAAAGEAAAPSALAEAVAALVALGHAPSQAEKLAARATREAGPEAGVEEVIRLALRG
jgi:Holliday junction DNA helicase RuvA